jgi:hypothetical protein
MGETSMRKCANCGYLSVRNKADYSLGEATIDFREKGKVPIAYDDKGCNPHALHEAIPLCFARQAYLASKAKEIEDRNNPVKEVKAIIQEENDCKEFTDWQQGFTPKEHREMMAREEMRRWYSGQQWKLVAVAGVFVLLGGFLGALITWLLTRGG